MKNLLALSAIILLMSIPVSAWTSSAALDDSAVLSAIMQDRCASSANNPDGRYQVVPAEADEIEVQSFPKSFDAGAVKSLISRNKTTHPLPRIELCSSFKRVSSAKVATFFAPNNGAATGWRGFYRAFPGAQGISSLSLPGYSKGGKLAIVQVSSSCGEMCSSGFYWVLRKVHGKWVVYKSSPAWVS
ncbi:hypothetical protein [Rhodanobacter sp. C03]|uniref:hypothetical protein n=1 Tax=Rhodanobacter sp. C03 TaxID=1945858 RepID=UPI0011154CF2|nr:hypothetical protein [Rhodanobacter sp. C03]